MQELDASLENRLKLWDEGQGFAAIRDAWMARAVGVGGAAAAPLGGREISGIFKGLADDGALILELADGSHKSIHAGEVRFAEIETLRKRQP